jgi:hypothetical protein
MKCFLPCRRSTIIEGLTQILVIYCYLKETSHQLNCVKAKMVCDSYRKRLSLKVKNLIQSKFISIFELLKKLLFSYVLILCINVLL